MSLFIKQMGDAASKQALVFFHGWGFDHRVWLKLAEKLEHRFALYLLDLPGFGKSPYMPWEHFKEHLEGSLPKSYALLGWSLGGLYALRLAYEKPSAVSKLITVASSPCFVKKEGWPGLEARLLSAFCKKALIHPEKCRNDFLALFREDERQALSIDPFSHPLSPIYPFACEGYEPWESSTRHEVCKSEASKSYKSSSSNETSNSHENLSLNETSNLHKSLNLNKSSKPSPKPYESNGFYEVELHKAYESQPQPQPLSGWSEGLKTLKNTDFRALLGQLACPVCHFFGTEDKIVPISTQKALSKAYPKHQYHVFKGAGHAPFLSFEQLFLDKLEEFLL